MNHWPQILFDRAAEPLRWLIVGGIAYTLATSILYLLAEPSASDNPIDTTATGGEVAPKEVPTFSLQDVLTRNLFGELTVQLETDVSDEPAVETRLPLELNGVFVADTPEDSVAIVAQKGKPGLLYRIGEKVPGNAELIEVHHDQIILRRAGAREVLRFVSESGGGFTADKHEEEPPAPSTGISSRGELPTPTTAREFVEVYRDRLAADPQGTLSQLGISSVSESDSSGYRLDNLADSPYLSQTGLQAGDVILSVNGRPVGNVGQDQLEMNNVLAQGSARLEVQRGSRRFFITASLK